ncbi:MmgE/PrpD family protein [Anderseniella sp. Alg231-50]|uniref:MmgE/PrpD family protein n=1 Tax=Anderseniella sp. Alg231-50 TaxID=1922226 RepID=UPI00307B99C7
MTAHNHAIQTLADAVLSMEIENVPDDAVNNAKRCLIDVCGVTLAGAKTDSAKTLYETAVETYKPGCCNILGTSHVLNAPGAAFANGAAAHALDFDDNCYAGIVHGSAVVFPSVLAIAQQRGATGAELLLGFVTGLEVEFAVAKALSNSIYDRGWWTTSVLGTIGSAAGAAKIARLDNETTRNALALAVVGAGATRAVRGTTAKHYYCGRAAESGVLAVMAAERGATGPINAFEDQSGIARVLNGAEFDPKAIEALGVEFGISQPGVDIKKYPVCYASHAAADATKEIMNSNGLTANDVAAVTCTVPPLVASNLTYSTPKTAAEAQFSLEFAISSIIEHGDIELKHLETAILTSPPIERLLGKIVVKVGDVPERYRSAESICPEWGSVELVTHCGARKLAFAASPIGSASRPLSDDMLQKKFNSCAEYRNSANAPLFLYGRMRNIELIGNAQELFT